jgi:hypothetical protein
MSNVTVVENRIIVKVTPPDSPQVSIPVIRKQVVISPTGPQGAGAAQTFETIANNHRGYAVISTSASATQVIKVFDSGDGTTITATLNIVNGLPTTKVLTGDGLPPNIDTICTYDFSEGTDRPPKKTYSR